MVKLHVVTQDMTDPIATHEPEPLPIQVFPIDTVDGRVIYAVWFNADAARCRACPAETCTFTPSPQGVGTCYHNVQGGLGRLSARLSASVD